MWNHTAVADLFACFIVVNNLVEGIEGHSPELDSMNVNVGVDGEFGFDGVKGDNWKFHSPWYLSSQWHPGLV